MTDPLGEFDGEVRALVDQAVRSLVPDLTLALETPPAGLADRAVACFPLAKPLRKNPVEIAADLARNLQPALASARLVERVEATNGYLNFFVHRGRLAERILPAVLTEGERFGTLAAQPKSVILEHTSANPNGPLHVGRTRNPIIGDTLLRILRKAGWNVESQYYVDDVGKQVAILAWGRTHLKSEDLPPTAHDKVDHDLVRYYQAANERMEKDQQVAAEIQELVRRSEVADPETLRLFTNSYEPILKGMLASLARIGIAFDSFVKESRFIENKDTERIVDRLQRTPLSREEHDGALFLDLSGHGIQGRSQRFVYRRSDGTSLYATRDIAYHFWKAKHADRLINVLGEDHKLQAQQVRISLELLGCPVIPEVIFYAFVSLPEGKMSTRRGRVVFLDDLIDEAVELAYEEVKKRRGNELNEEQLRRIAEAVGVGALRYNIVRVQPEKGITFRWEDALNFEGASAPFLQYAYARCASILRKAGAAYERTPIDAKLLSHPSELELIRQIARLPRIVDEAARRDTPHLVAGYGQDLASALNAFYRDCAVLNAETLELKRTRLQLVDAARLTLRSTLDLLGIPVLEEM